MTDWDARFIRFAREVATWSKDPSTQVGAVIVDSARRVVSTGFNGLPRGVDDTPERLQNRDVKLRLTLHAEHNAVLFARRALEGCTLYSTRPCCAQCAAVIIQSGLTRVVIDGVDVEVFRNRWREDCDLAEQILHEAGVDYHAIDWA